MSYISGLCRVKYKGKVIPILFVTEKAVFVVVPTIDGGKSIWQPFARKGSGYWLPKSDD
jgi:hypothetical protein